MRGQDLRLARLQQLDERLEARPQPLDLRRVDADGVGKFLVGESTHGTHGHQVLERPARGAARVRGLRGAELHRVVAEVGVVDAAQRLRGLIVHGHWTS